MADLARAGGGDRAAIETLLAAAGLPLAGLTAALPTAIVARLDGRLVGCAAIEPYGRLGLLRSVCVAPQLRGQGLGRQLVDAAEALAGELGIDELYLVTETAGAWFPGLGYRPVDRDRVPDALHASVEFQDACPDSALVMWRPLGPAAAVAESAAP